MRFFEIAEPTETQPASPAAPKPVQKVKQPAPVAQTKAAPPEDVSPVYADNKQLKALAQFLEKQLPDGKFSVQNAGGTKQISSIRARGISVAALKQAMAEFGAAAGSPDQKQVTTSSSFPANSFEKDNTLYTVVIGMKGVKAGDEESTGIARKELSPAGLGIHGGVFNKNELISATKKAVEAKIRKRDPMLADALNSLIDNAASGGTAPIPAEQMAHIKPFLGTVSQDFGEILAPILVMKEGDKAELPTGNNPLVDVKLPGMNMSVKALTGSGTSFRAISDLMDKYETSIKDDPEAKERYNILKQFHPSTGGNNKDKIIRAAAAADIPEYKSLIKILGVNGLSSFADLASAVQAKTGSADYATFLKTFFPMMTAGPWGKPVGLPADGMYYLGKTDKLKKEKAAGRPSYQANPTQGGADIITYSLGVGLLNDIRQGDKSEKYKSMMTDIVNKADAVIGHISIAGDGTIKLITKPFSTLQFNFQYHAPSHIPGNNLPGFIAVLD